MTFLYRVVVFAIISIALAACTSTPNPIGVTSSSALPIATPAVCQPSQIQHPQNGLSEVQGTTNSAVEIWALLFFDQAHAKQDSKIVWRITGTGSFSVQARHEDGTVIHPIWGPEYHESSTWERPGDEWGTGFNFPKPGCWTLTVTRGAAAGEIRLEVLDPVAS